MHFTSTHFPVMAPTGVMVRQEVTGILAGGEMTAPAAGTTFSIADGHGQIVDCFTKPESPTLTRVRWSGKTNITDTLLTESVNYILINETGAVIQQSAAPSDAQLKDNLFIGAIAHANNLIIASASLQTAAYNNGGLAHVLLQALGTITTGCVYSGVAAALQMARTSGSIYRQGASYSTNKKTPNLATLALQTPVQFASYCRNGSNTVFSNSTVGTTLTVNRYDDGTAAAAGIPNGVLLNNKWQAIRLFLSTNGFTLMQYGQAVYGSLSEAQAGASGELWYQAPITNLTAFRGYLFVRGGAADLSIVGDAFFQNAGKLGDSGTALAAAAVPAADDANLISAGLAFQNHVFIPVTPGFPGFLVPPTIYTPTLTNVANLDASTAYSCQYSQNGRIVTVSGQVDIDPTAPAALTKLGISLPIASDFTAANECAGVAAASGIAAQVAAIRADATNNRAELVYISSDITNQPMYFSFTYRVL